MDAISYHMDAIKYHKAKLAQRPYVALDDIAELDRRYPETMRHLNAIFRSEEYLKQFGLKG